MGGCVYWKSRSVGVNRSEIKLGEGEEKRRKDQLVFIIYFFFPTCDCIIISCTVYYHLHRKKKRGELVVMTIIHWGGGGGKEGEKMRQGWCHNNSGKKAYNFFNATKALVFCR